MVPNIRQQFNAQFTDEAYQALRADIETHYPGQLDFRIAETPIFIPKAFTQKMLDACEHIIDVITSPNYRVQSNAAIPATLQVPNEDGHPHFIAFDFGICTAPDGSLEPQLIELQGFPSLFAYQILFPELSRAHFNIPDNYDAYLNGFTKERYIGLLKKLILGDCEPDSVILLEIAPDQQKTRIDFRCTETYVGINTVDLMDVFSEGRELFYNKDGKKIKINRIYNRIIFDDLFQQPTAVQEKGKLLLQDLDVTWVPHPAWFYRISKFTLPFIHHPFVPQTQFLSDVKEPPADLENYVVKPLFSFAGQGVIIDVKEGDIEKIKDPLNWIIQKTVPYAAAIETPGEWAKAEIRLFYFWEEGAPRPVATNNLARLSKGKMVGVRYNKDKSWVGGTLAFFEK
ncbi:MAG TPA: hypothetical protein VM010_07220 [Chitinophagaceae bacterium]|nr:hypothetical protein [Chitinophagaceae bacterium]